MLFSQREGYKPIKDKIQVDFMDHELRVSLWNIFYQVCYRSNLRRFQERYVPLLWSQYFKKPLDTISETSRINLNFIKDYFFKCKWYEVYDLIEFAIRKLCEDKETFIRGCNIVLERERSGYRIINGLVVRITDNEELKSVEESLKKTEPFSGVHKHLQTALQLLSDRKNPDYRNSIKESISAVEAICRIITGDEKATLGQALGTLEKTTKIHPALKKAFENLYGYTSDSDGIRHAMIKETHVGFKDAKFMLVVCSAFINFLIEKLRKTGRWRK